MTAGEIIASVMAGLFALAFAAWARRLDSALDLLEKIQEQMHQAAVVTERRLTRLESMADWCAHQNKKPSSQPSEPN